MNSKQGRRRRRLMARQFGWGLIAGLLCSACGCFAIYLLVF